MDNNAKKDIAKLSKRELAISEYFDGQVALFEEVNEKAVKAGREKPYPNPSVSATYNIIVKSKDGKYTVRKRCQPFSDADFDNSGVHNGKFCNKSFGERIGATAMTTDETKLFLSGQMCTGLEIGEVESVGSVCV